MELGRVIFLLILAVLGICTAYLESNNENCSVTSSSGQITYQVVDADGESHESHEIHETQIDIDGRVINDETIDDTMIDETFSETSIDNSFENTIDPKIEKTKKPVANPKQMQVVFRNKSNKKVKLWWKGGDDGKVLQGEIEDKQSRTINTFFGHEFFFTPFDNEEEVLHSVRMENHVDEVELLTPEEMANRNTEFENEKREFKKKYFEETGRRWKNYYPREPVTHFMYDIQNTGQLLKPKTNFTKYQACPSILYEFEEFNNILSNLETQEEEYKVNEFEAIHTARLEKESEDKDDRNYFHHVPAYNTFIDYFEIDTKDGTHLNYKIARYNGTVFCQDLDEIDATIEMEVLCTEPRVVRILNFLSNEECDHITEIGYYVGMRRSTVSESAVKTQDRTSSTVWLQRKFSPILDNVVKRIATAVGVDESLLHLNASSESLQFVHYLEGELYKPHVDYGTDLPNNRFITFLMYLNTVDKGGNTSFPKASESCKGENDYFGISPMRGSAAWFYDLFEDGNVDPSTLHYAEPPTNGSEKYMTNLWIWDPFFK